MGIFDEEREAVNEGIFLGKLCAAIVIPIILAAIAVAGFLAFWSLRVLVYLWIFLKPHAARLYSWLQQRINGLYEYQRRKWNASK